MPAMPVVVPATVEGFVLVGHRGSAAGAELRAFGYHTLRNFRDIRNKIGAELHRVLGAGRAGIGTALRPRSAKPGKQCTDRQSQPADKT